MEGTDDVLGTVICTDVVTNIGGEPIEVAIDTRSVLAARILDRKLFNIQRREWWSVPREFKTPDWIVFQILGPFVDDLIDRHVELGCLLAGLDFRSCQRCRTFARHLDKTDRLARFICQIDTGCRPTASAFGSVVRRLAKKKR